MRIVFIGPGKGSIPPRGWGAVECLIWDLAIFMREHGHDVFIVNETNKSEIIKRVLELNPDIVHLQYDEYIDVVNVFSACLCVTSHYGYILHKDFDEGYKKIFAAFVAAKHAVICALSPQIAQKYIDSGAKNVKITPNGADETKFFFTPTPLYGQTRSLYLAKIEPRKRQHVYQSIPSLFFAGNCITDAFDCSRTNYLGEWTKETLYTSMTHYGNLVLLSDGEAHPLVVCEALVCGLGLVLSKYAAANLDLSKPWISVISDDKWNDLSFVEQTIVENRKTAMCHRSEIREYALVNFSWKVRAQHLLDVYEESYFLHNKSKIKK